MAKILIADDSAFMRKVLGNTLKKFNHEVIECGDGSEAVEKYPQVKPALVFLDVVMVKMSGIDALKAIRAQDPAAKVVMCTAIGQDAVINEAKAAGAMGYVVKPFKEEQVVEVLKQAGLA